MAESLLKYPSVPGVDTKLSISHYRSDNFAFKRLLEFQYGHLYGQKIEILNMSAQPQNFDLLKQTPKLVSFASTLASLQPGESTYAIVFYQKN